MVCHSVRTFRRWGCHQIVVAGPPDHLDELSNALGDEADHVVVVAGADSRASSTFAALKRIDAPFVLVHDAARPFVSLSLLDRLLDALPGADGVIPVMPATDTVKRVVGDEIVETMPRDDVRFAQTPQLFGTRLLRAAHARAAEQTTEFTDDASIMEQSGGRVRVVQGDPRNVKITTARDMPTVRAAPDIRVGHGYDTHRTASGEAVMLCGVRVAAPFTLDGHSDADVGLHALVDALLGTCGLGDIGSHFPPTDDRWRGASSDRFLDHAVQLVRERRGRITCADVTLICESPKIGPHREAMRSRVASMLGIEIDRVSVKATTNERIGFVGRNEGLAALATATVIYD